MTGRKAWQGTKQAVDDCGNGVFFYGAGKALNGARKVVSKEIDRAL